MPWEYTALKGKPWPKIIDPKCDCQVQGKEPFMRGMVQSAWRKFFGMPYCAVICPATKNIVAWEKPEKKQRPF